MLNAFQTNGYAITEEWCEFFRENHFLIGLSVDGTQELHDVFRRGADGGGTYVGKWHLDGGDYFGNGRCPEGWNPDYWYDMKTYLNELSDADKVRSRDPKETYKEGFSEEFTYAHRCSDRAIRYLEEFKDQDFFLSVSYDEPHGPSLCPSPFNHMYDGFKFDHNPSFQDDLSKKPFMQRLWAGKNIYASEDQINQASDGLSLFLGCNSFADYEIGRVLDKIREFTRYEVDHDGFGGLQIMRAVTSDRYKLVLHLCDTDEFYDMQEDLYEIHNLIDDERYTEVRNELHDKLIAHMNDTRDLYRGYQWGMRPWRPDFVPNWENEGYTRQRENEEYEPRQLDYDTGLPMETAVRKKN